MAVRLEAGTTSSDERWPMTTEAHAALEAEASRLHAELVGTIGFAGGLEGESDAPYFAPNPSGLRLVDQLKCVRLALEHAEICDERDVAVIGRSVTLDDDGDSLTRALVAPSLADDRHAVSMASPIGRALVRSRPGDTVAIDAPTGVRRIRVIAVR